MRVLKTSPSIHQKKLHPTSGKGSSAFKLIQQSNTPVVGQGQTKIATNPSIQYLATCEIHTCVAVTFYDPTTKSTALSHIDDYSWNQYCCLKKIINEFKTNNPDLSCLNIEIHGGVRVDFNELIRDLFNICLTFFAAYLSFISICTFVDLPYPFVLSFFASQGLFKTAQFKVYKQRYHPYITTIFVHRSLSFLKENSIHISHFEGRLLVDTKSSFSLLIECSTGTITKTFSKTEEKKLIDLFNQGASDKEKEYLHEINTSWLKRNYGLNRVSLVLNS